MVAVRPAPVPLLPIERRERRVLLGVVALGLALRLAAAFHGTGQPLTGDQLSYDQVAWNLASGHGYAVGDAASGYHATATRGPSYVLLVALLFTLFGHGPWALFLVQALLDAASVLLVFRIGRLVFGRADAALAGAALYAIYPPFVLETGLMLSETLVNALVLAAIAAWLEAEHHGEARGRGLAATVLSGLAVGLAALSKPILAPLAGLFFLAGWSPARPLRGFGRLGLQVCVVSLVLAPWIARNAGTFHAFVPGVSLGGVTFWGGTGPAGGHVIGGLDDPKTPPGTLAAVRGMDEIARDRWFYAEGRRVIAAHPGRYAVLLLKKIPRLWLNLGHDAPPSRASLLLAAFNLLAIGVAVRAARTLNPDPAAGRLLLLLALYFTAIHLAFFAVVRYAFPVYAYLFAFTGAGALGILRRGRRSPRPRNALPAEGQAVTHSRPDRPGG